MAADNDSLPAPRSSDLRVLDPQGESRTTKAMPRKSKRQRFEEMAEKRTNVVLEKLKILGNCANKASYEYTPEDVRRIFDAIEEQVRVVKAKFADAGSARFRL